MRDIEQDELHAIYLNYAWFYYSNTAKKYIELDSFSTFKNPVTNKDIDFPTGMLIVNIPFTLTHKINYIDGDI
ncbi:hypothetical protein JKI98_11045 [Acinetobacter nectaris]|nr:hypothetical protein [Acinetobacter nectaris]